MNAKTLIAKSLLTGALPLAFFSAALAAPADAHAQQRQAPSSEREGIEPRKIDIGVRATLSAPALRATRQGQRLTLDLAPERQLSMATLSRQRLPDGRQLVKGRVGQRGDATLMVDGNDIVGTIKTGEGETYRVRPTRNGNVIEKLDWSKIPSEGPMLASGPQGLNFQAPGPGGLPPAPPPQGNYQSAQKPTLDILVAYTPRASNRIWNMDATLDLALAESNEGLENSEIDAHIRMLDSMPAANIDDTGTYGDIFDQAFVDQQIASRRAAIGADLVVLIVDNDEWCGMAPYKRVKDEHAVVIVHWDCVTGTYSFAHEIGHAVGTGHNVFDEDNPIADYGHGRQVYGYDVPDPYRSVMAYNKDGYNLDRINVWSNPDIMIEGRPFGSESQMDNARIWRENINRIAGLRSAVLNPGPMPRATEETKTRGAETSPPARASRPARKIPARSSR